MNTSSPTASSGAGTGSTGTDYGRRPSPLWALIAVVVIWLAIIKLVGAGLSGQAHVIDGRLLTVQNLMYALVIPLGAATVFVYGVIAALGWWRPLLHDPLPVRRWVWVIAGVFAIAILLGINYSGLADRGPGFTLTLIAVALLVGFGEEGLFRCIGVTTLRRMHLSEGKVALWSSVIFGLAHIANLIGGNPGALAQALIVSLAGYFFYLIRRVSRSNILNSVLHGFFDFTILSSTAILPQSQQPHVIGAALAMGLLHE